MNSLICLITVSCPLYQPQITRGLIDVIYCRKKKYSCRVIDYTKKNPSDIIADKKTGRPLIDLLNNSIMSDVQKI